MEAVLVEEEEREEPILAEAVTEESLEASPPPVAAD
jgi:hypothetical protein